MHLLIPRLIRFLFVVAAFVLTLRASPRQNPRESLDFKTDTQKIRIVPIAVGLDSPWSMVFLPSGDILVTERPGRLRLTSNGRLDDEPIGGLPETSSGRTAACWMWRFIRTS